jgi:hypothetical protein
MTRGVFQLLSGRYCAVEEDMEKFRLWLPGVRDGIETNLF